MISFRNHVVSLAAVFLALAIGVVLGGGPLSEVGRADTGDQPAATSAGDAAAGSAFQDAFATRTASKTLAGRLSGRTVVLVTAPGSDERTVTALTGLVRTAGGSVVGSYAVSEAMLAPEEKTLVDTLGTQLDTSLKSVSVPSSVPTYERMGQLMGLGIASKTPAGAAGDSDSSSVVESLAGAELMSAKGPAGKRGALVLVILGDEVTGEAEPALAGLLTGLGRSALGVDVAGTTAASGEGGALAELRADKAFASAPNGNVSSTDSVETGAGRVTALLGLAAASTDKAGAFGASGSDGAVPVG